MLRRVSRRQLLAALGAIPVAAFLGRWFWRALRRRPATLDPESATAISRVCDRFIPGIDGRPGAVALGIDKKILREWGRLPELQMQLRELGDRLRRDRFLSMRTEEQDAYLQEQLLEGEGSSPFDQLLDRCVRDFYTHPQSWISLAYTKPQPEGYPDYARCG
jgi:hypothetical protein